MKWLRKFSLYTGIVCAGIAAAAGLQRVSAQNDTSGQTPGRIGVVNRKAVFDAYDARKAEWDALEAEKNKLQADIDALRESVNAGRKKLREEGAKMTEEQRQQLTDKVEADARAYDDRWRRAQGEIDGKSDKFFGKILGNIDAGVKEVGGTQNYKIVLEADPKAGSPVLYFDPSLDLTEKVTAHLNKK